MLCHFAAFDRVSHIFRLHGAALFETPLIAPKTDKVLAKTNPAAYLDPTGVLVQLPYTLTVPFARAVAQKYGPLCMKKESRVGTDLIGFA